MAQRYEWHSNPEIEVVSRGVEVGDAHVDEDFALLIGDPYASAYVIENDAESLLEWLKEAADAVREAAGISDVAVTLTKDDVATLRSIFDSARRGREDFEYLVSRNAGDYEEGDIAETRGWHEREKALEQRLYEALKED